VSRRIKLPASRDVARRLAERPEIAVFLVAIVLVAMPDGLVPAPLRVLAALTVAALLGHLVGLAIVPARLGTPARLTLSTAAALALPIAVALVLTVTPAGLGRPQLVGAAVLIGVAAWLIVLVRGTPLMDTTRRLAFPAGSGRRTTGLYILAAIGVTIALGLRLTATQTGDAPFTELWVDAGTPYDGRVAVHAVNQEGADVYFRIEIRVNNILRSTRTNLLSDGEAWTFNSPTLTSPGQRIDVRMLRGANGTSTYRSVVVTMGTGW
jgi:uncharacterized membrane protein